jgi:hypothetical protein
MTDVQGTLGTTIRVVVGEPTAYSDDGTDGFPGLTFKEVGEVAEIGDYGGDSEIVTHTPVKSGIVNKRLGPTDYGEMQIQMARVTSDDGQEDMRKGFDGVNKGKVHSFEVKFADGGIEYFTGIIRSFLTQPGSASNIVRASSAIALTNKVLVIDAPE